MDIQQRTAQYGHWRNHPKAKIKQCTFNKFYPNALLKMGGLPQIHRHYGVQIEQGGRSRQWHIGPVAQLRLVQLNTPRIREQGINAQQIEAKRYRYADISVGVQGAWQLTEGAQSVQITHSLKYHRWLGSRPLSKQHLSWQLGYQQQLNQQWQFGFSTQGRLGKGLRDQGLNFNVTAVF